MRENDITGLIVNAAYEVHNELGPGLLESTYEECMLYELQTIGLDVKRQLALPVIFKEVQLNCGYRIDLLVEDKIIVEIKAVEALKNIHMAQIITYLKLSNKKIGLLINFNVSLIKNGIKRVANSK